MQILKLAKTFRVENFRRKCSWSKAKRKKISPLATFACAMLTPCCFLRIYHSVLHLWNQRAFTRQHALFIFCFKIHCFKIFCFQTSAKFQMLY